MSGDAEQVYFCDGLVEDIITTLSELAGLGVMRTQFQLRLEGTFRLMSARRLSNLACDTL